MDDLTVIVYESHRPGDERMPVELRLRWLRELYPHVESILALDAPLADVVDTSATRTRGPRSTGRCARTVRPTLACASSSTARSTTTPGSSARNDVDWIQSAPREMAADESIRLQERHVRDLERRVISYVAVTEPVEERVEQVQAALGVPTVVATE